MNGDYSTTSDPRSRRAVPRMIGPTRAKGGLTLGKKSHLVAALVQAGALLINHIAPGNRTLAPSA